LTPGQSGPSAKKFRGGDDDDDDVDMFDTPFDDDDEMAGGGQVVGLPDGIFLKRDKFLLFFIA
jgi:hypothetical protein